MNQRQLASAVLLGGVFNVLACLALVFGDGGGGQLAKGVDGKKVLITFNQETKEARVIAGTNWYDSADFHAWVETVTDKPTDGVPNWKVYPVGVTVDADLPQWKILIPLATQKGKDTLTVTKDGYYYTFNLPDDEATGRSIIERYLK